MITDAPIFSHSVYAYMSGNYRLPWLCMSAIACNSNVEHTLGVFTRKTPLAIVSLHSLWTE